MTTLAKPEIKRFSIPEYYRLAELGFIKPEERTELVNGQIIKMAPPGPDHETFLYALAEIFSDNRDDGYQVRVNSPVRIPDINEPLPDIVLCRRNISGRLPVPLMFSS